MDWLLLCDLFYSWIICITWTRSGYRTDRWYIDRNKKLEKETIAPQLALPATFCNSTARVHVNFIPVGLGLAEAEPETIEVGVLSVMYSRFLTGWIRVLIAYAASLDYTLK